MLFFAIFSVHVVYSHKTQTCSLPTHPDLPKEGPKGLPTALRRAAQGPSGAPTTGRTGPSLLFLSFFLASPFGAEAFGVVNKSLLQTRMVTGFLPKRAVKTIFETKVLCEKLRVTEKAEKDESHTLCATLLKYWTVNLLVYRLVSNTIKIWT
jgi:hypothetical protein